MKALIFTILIMLFIIIIPSYTSYADIVFPDYVTVGTVAGYSVITGYYSNSLDNGIGAGLFFFVPFADWGMINNSLTYSRFTLTHSSNSTMQSFGITIIPSLYFTIPYDVTLYAGAGFCVQYHTLFATNTGVNDATYKSGIAMSAGIAKSIFPRTLIATECTYLLSELSHKKFQNIVICMKAGYQFALHQPLYYIAKEAETAKIHEKRIEHLYNCGTEYVQKKDHVQALDCFHKVLSLKPDHKNALHYIASISLALEQYNSALVLLKQHREFEALPLIANASTYIAHAEMLLQQMKMKYTSEILKLTKMAIESFNKKDYDNCIATMNVVLVIDPDNDVAKAYIVRSKRIKETMQKLQ